MSAREWARNAIAYARWHDPGLWIMPLVLFGTILGGFAFLVAQVVRWAER